jgi:hypothetical protein
MVAAALGRGRVHPDEIFQYLEPAHYVAFGTWLPSWEWGQGLRNWAAPAALGALLKLAAAAGGRDPWAQAAVVWAACASLQAWGVVGLYRLIEHRDGARVLVFGMPLSSTGGRFFLGRDQAAVRLAGGEPEQEIARDLRDTVYSHVLVGPRGDLDAALEEAGFARWKSFSPYVVWKRAR